MPGLSLKSFERALNWLPEPATIFTLLIFLLIIIANILSTQNIGVEHPVTGQTLTIRNLLDSATVLEFVKEMPRTFATFPPLGLVIVVMLGAGLAEKTGFFSAMLTGIARSAPSELLTATILLLGIFSSVAVDAGYVVIVPLGAILYGLAGRHPVAGIAAAFAGVAGGLTANLIIAPFDVLMASITEQAAHQIDPGYTVSALSNYYFMFAMTPALMIGGIFVTERIIEPYLGPAPKQDVQISSGFHEKPGQRRIGLLAALIATILYIAGVSFLRLNPGGAFVPTAENASPLVESLPALIFGYFLTIGLVYGVAAGKIRSDIDAIRLITQSIADLAPYIVLIFVASQFIWLFNKSNIGIVFALSSAKAISSLSLPTIVLLIALIVVSGVFNLVIGSASAKWLMLSIVTVPSMMMLGISPEAAQLSYRIGDSVTNMITPLFPYFPLIIAMMRKYDPKASTGKLITIMLPYSAAFFMISLFMIAVWYFCRLPIGPGTDFEFAN